jgi:hypothetical protein
MPLGMGHPANQVSFMQREWSPVKVFFKSRGLFLQGRGLGFQFLNSSA